MRRQMARMRLWWLGRLASRAETNLGFLGWQQADFDAETERQVKEIQDVEREQTRLTNEAATHGQTCRTLRSELEALFRTRFEGRKQLAADERRVREPRVEIEAKLAAKRKIEPNFERRMPDLDRELREVSKLLTELLGTETLNPKVRQELARLRERSVAIPNEKNDLRTQHLRTVTEIRALEESLAANLLAAAEVQERTNKAEGAWTEAERAVQARIDEEERLRSKVEKRIQELEKAKANPYLAIGKVLAQSGLAPLNQPQALERVKKLNFRQGELRQIILESTEKSAAEDPAGLRQSRILWAVVLALAVLLLYLALS